MDLELRFRGVRVIPLLDERAVMFSISINVDRFFAFRVDNVVHASTEFLDVPLRFRHLRVIP